MLLTLGYRTLEPLGHGFLGTRTHFGMSSVGTVCVEELWIKTLDAKLSLDTNVKSLLSSHANKTGAASWIIGMMVVVQLDGITL